MYHLPAASRINRGVMWGREFMAEKPLFLSPFNSSLLLLKSLFKPSVAASMARLPALRVRWYFFSVCSRPISRLLSIAVLIISERQAASSKPRLTPWPARGWMLCAASPMSAIRGAT